MTETTNQPELIILPKHFDDKDTLIYGKWVMNGCKLFDRTNEEHVKYVLNRYDVPDDVWQQVVDAEPNGIMESEWLPKFAYNIALKGDLSLRHHIIAGGKHASEFAFYYCKNISNDADMRQVIIDSKDSRSALNYCMAVSKDEDMRRVITHIKDPYMAYQYCRDISNDDGYRQIIIDKKCPMVACYYCDVISDDIDMRQVIIDSKYLEACLFYCIKVKINPIMRQIIIDSGDPDIALQYCLHLGADEEMKNVIFTNGLHIHKNDYMNRVEALHRDRVICYVGKGEDGEWTFTEKHEEVKVVKVIEKNLSMLAALEKLKRGKPLGIKLDDWGDEKIISKANDHSLYMPFNTDENCMDEFIPMDDVNYKNWMLVEFDEKDILNKDKTVIKPKPISSHDFKDVLGLLKYNSKPLARLEWQDTEDADAALVFDGEEYYVCGVEGHRAWSIALGDIAAIDWFVDITR